jgi:hypothetical protein
MNVIGLTKQVRSLRIRKVASTEKLLSWITETNDQSDPVKMQVL